MRRFLLLVHKVPPSGDFTLNDLAGSGGRVDEVAAVVGASFLVSNGLRRDTELHLLLVADPDRPLKVRWEGSRLRFLNPDERSTAALLKNALVRSATRPQAEMETTPGIFVGPVEPLPYLREFLARPGCLWATEHGAPLRAAALRDEAEVSVVVSDPWDPTPAEREVLSTSGALAVSVGPRSLRASQCVVVLQNELDLREGRTSPAPPTPTTSSGSPSPGSGGPAPPPAR